MANMTYVQQNRLRQELEAGRSRLVLPVVICLSALNLIVLWKFGMFAVVSGFLSLVVIGAMSGTAVADPLKKAGADGEDLALSYLEDLPEQYTVFNQLVVPDPTSAYGKREIDFVVLGPNGLFLVECKNFKGALRGQPADPSWELHKVGRRGTPYSTKVTNPVRQLDQQARALHSFLEARSLRPPLVKLVAMAGCTELSAVSSPRIPILAAQAIPQRILGHQGQIWKEAVLVAALAELRQYSFYDDLPRAA